MISIHEAKPQCPWKGPSMVEVNHPVTRMLSDKVRVQILCLPPRLAPSSPKELFAYLQLPVRPIATRTDLLLPLRSSSGQFDSIQLHRQLRRILRRPHFCPSSRRRHLLRSLPSRNLSEVASGRVSARRNASRGDVFVSTGLVRPGVQGASSTFTLLPAKPRCNNGCYSAYC